MAALKTIALLGATGNMGSAIAKGIAKGNYRLLLMSHDHDKLVSLKSELETPGSKAEILVISCAREASWEADIIIMATPYAEEKEVAQKIKEVATGKVVISIPNPLSGSYFDLVTSPHTSAAEELQKMLPHAKVVKAFHTTLAATFISPAIDAKDSRIFIAGNCVDAVDTVCELARTAGFNPVIAGDLTISRTLERTQLKLIRQGSKYNYNWLAAWTAFQNQP